jgi:hypothetical protein
MSELSKRPVVIVVIIVALVAAIAFGWTRYRAMTGVTKENSVQLSPDQLKEMLRRDK